MLPRVDCDNISSVLDGPVNLVGLKGQRTRPQSYIMSYRVHELAEILINLGVVLNRGG